VEPGADADLVLFDPGLTGPLADGELHGAAGFTPFAGLQLAGRVAATYCRGALVFERDSGLTGDPGHGRFIERTPFDPSHLG